MDETTTLSIKDRYIAAALVAVLLIAYMVLAVMRLDTKFIEGAFLVALGVLGGLLKSSSTNVGMSKETNVNN